MVLGVSYFRRPVGKRVDTRHVGVHSGSLGKVEAFSRACARLWRHRSRRRDVPLATSLSISSSARLVAVLVLTSGLQPRLFLCAAAALHFWSSQKCMRSGELNGDINWTAVSCRFVGKLMETCQRNGEGMSKTLLSTFDIITCAP